MSIPIDEFDASKVVLSEPQRSGSGRRIKIKYQNADGTTSPIILQVPSMMPKPFNDAETRKHLTADDGQYCKAVEEFFTVPKRRRTKNTYKDTLAHFTTDDGVKVWITLHQLSLWQDKDFVGKQHLRRGHIVEKHYTQLPNGRILNYYQDFGAHPKFANLGQSGFPEASREYLENLTDAESVLLFVKESGSMNIAVFPPRNYYIHDDHVNTDRKSDLSYQHPMEYYVTSKNGWNNEYARAGDTALQRVLATRGKTTTDLYNYLQMRGTRTIVYELMKYQEHVYADTKEELYVHLVDNCRTFEMHAFLMDYLPVVEHVASFTNVSDALQRWEQDNEECNHELEGYVLVVGLQEGRELKVKLKFWKYLALREFREALKRNVCPTVEELENKYKLWDMPKSEWNYYCKRTRTWFWWVQSPHCNDEYKAALAEGRYVAVRDKFFEIPAYNLHFLIESVAAEQPVMIYFVLTGVQCVGKSHVREKINTQYQGFVRSQDECGGVRGNLIEEIKEWASYCTKPGCYSTIIDRCNLNWEQRRTIFNELEKVPHKGFVVTVNISHKDGEGVELELLQRFMNRKDHPSFSPHSVGAIRGLEIIRSSSAMYTPSPDGPVIPYKNTDTVNEVLYQTVPLTFNPVEYDNYKQYRNKSRKLRLVYGGIVTPMLCMEVLGFDCTNDPTVKWHGSHVTLAYGKDQQPLPEGEPVTVTVYGTYRGENIYGLLVGVPGYDVLKHITLYTKNNTPPAKSNAVIEELFGKVPDTTDVGRQINGVEWLSGRQIQGWYGNYYTDRGK